jgi:hypothetical protein
MLPNRKSIPTLRFSPSSTSRSARPPGANTAARSLSTPRSMPTARHGCRCSSLTAAARMISTMPPCSSSSIASPVARTILRLSQGPNRSILPSSAFRQANGTDSNADTLIGELRDADGLWTVLIKPSKAEAERVLHAGCVLPAQAEIANPPSISDHHGRCAGPCRLANVVRRTIRRAGFYALNFTSSRRAALRRLHSRHPQSANP